MASLVACSPVAARPALLRRPAAGRRAAAVPAARRAVLVRAEGEKKPEADLLSNVVREYREDSGEVAASAAAKAEEAAAKKGGQYIDELPEIQRTEMSDAQKAKLRAEYYSFGGAPNKSMGANYFLWIIVVISALAVASALTGAL